MIFLGNLKHIEGSKYEASLEAYDVGERSKKRNLTVEEFAKQVLEEKIGLVVEQLPKVDKIEGKEAITCIDLEAQQVYYKYEDAPITEENKIEILEKQVAELSFLVMQLQGGTN